MSTDSGNIVSNPESQPVEDNGQDASNGALLPVSSPPDQGASPEDMGKVISANRKRSHKKGFDQGYLYARNELLSEMGEKRGQSMPPMAPSPTAPPPSAAPSQLAPPGVAPGAPSMTPNDVALIQYQTKIENLENKARAKFGETHFNTNSNEFMKKALNEKGENIHDDLGYMGMMKTAINLDNEDIVHELVTNPDLQSKLQNIHPAHWGREMLNAVKPSDSPSSGYNGHTPAMVVKATAYEPVDDLPNRSPNNGGREDRHDREKDLIKWVQDQHM